MTNIPPDHLAHDLTRTHRAITRGLAVTRARGALLLANGFPDEDTRRGFFDYARSLLTVLRSHHEVEDELVFPRLREIIEAPYDRLTAEHDRLAEQMNLAVAALETQDLNDLQRAFESIERLWHPHIAIEEQWFTTAALDSVLSPTEQAALGRAVGARTAAASYPAPLIIPFMLFNLEGRDRRRMEETLPPEVLQQLVPGPWKDLWAPMRPFLLA